ncbi:MULTISPECIES: peptidylprolyl isomerase [Acetobacter]|uniref:Parvulin-like PPIase n=1 Tax=Acetobacter cerevisiae TaxID=178900 RepID=A0A149VCH3_9PROT|nr:MULTISPECIES: peptidylprolyl isomerase [Acetobacter]KXU91848.1 peptidylprolyl isomerase [Acetobacter cerevisiae]KXV77603.1 peptidylprolyl isomerase [Acetobacter cerevisiae]MCP1270089.1 peptidylprolyl isomerase [Acetobacter cerevisiae]MCP1278043.1 peptidylprolyl isomerase [Acetobacter cerevisiae]GBQ06366.1 peptidyl-prolyl cis-trans isomerase [Acetobacter cerevisiae DSM 14362]
MRLRSLTLACSLTALTLASVANAAPHTHTGQTQAASASSTQAKAPLPDDTIIAVVNSIPLTTRDVNNRGKLFALSTGLPVNDELMQRLRPQIIRQLIDERLRTQEILSRHINTPPEQIAAAIAGIERRNGMPENALRDRLAQDGVSLTTLIDQIRVQIGWVQVLRQELGARGRVSAKEIAQREDALKRQDGRTEYNLSEIFVKVEDPRHAEEELAFTNTVIQELRKGAPFPIVAAQFSQSQTALDGGSMGWVQEDELDPAVIDMIKQMPVGAGAISNPIKVPGGFVIITVNGKRIIGHQPGHVISIRQAFLPFDAELNPEHITPQQQQTLQKAVKIAQTVHSCDEVAAINQQNGERRPSDPGELQLERMNPQMRGLLESLPLNKVSRPLVSTDGIDLIMVCSKKEKNFADRSPSEIADQLMNERVEQTARQLDSDLHRKAMIDMRIKLKGV